MIKSIIDLKKTKTINNVNDQEKKSQPSESKMS